MHLHRSIKTAVNFFKDRGFPIRLLETEAFLNITTHMSSDSVHPNNAGHLALANAFYGGFTSDGGTVDTKISDVVGSSGYVAGFTSSRTIGVTGVQFAGNRLLFGLATDDLLTPIQIKSYNTSSTGKAFRSTDSNNAELFTVYNNGDAKIKDLSSLFLFGSTFYIKAGTGLELRSPNLVNVVANGVSSTRIYDVGIAIGLNPSRDEYSMLHLTSSSRTFNSPRMASGTSISTKVKDLVVVTGGSGYTSATVSFSGGGGSGATATAAVSAGQVVSLTITNAGTGYTSSPTVTISGDGTGATARAGLLLDGSEIYSITNTQKEVYAKGAFRGITMNYDRTLTSGLWLRGGTTGERPTVLSGDYILRYNSTTSTPEILTSSTTYSLFQGLSASETLDFGSTAAGASTDLTITVTGAADGDVVSLGVPNASVTATGRYFAWVSATNTVTVRFSPTILVGSEDPASGTFKVTVTK